MKKKICHPNRVKYEKTARGKKYTVTLCFDEDQFSWISAAADHACDGCVCDFIGNAFWQRFEQYSKELAASLTGDTPIN